MVNESNKSPVPANYFLEPGYIYVALTSALISTVLGSSVSVCLYDRKRKVGGMNHFQRPSTRDKHEAIPRYGNVAISTLLLMMIDDGSELKDMEAQIFGGAHNPRVSTEDIGQENIKVARKILTKKGVRLVSEDVGGEKGRKVVFNTHTNETAVLKVNGLQNDQRYEG